MQNKPPSNNKTFDQLLTDLKKDSPNATEEQTNVLVNSMKLAAKIQRIQYLMYVDSGFTEEQALQLVSANSAKRWFK